MCFKFLIGLLTPPLALRLVFQLISFLLKSVCFIDTKTFFRIQGCIATYIVGKEMIQIYFFYIGISYLCQ